DRRRRRGWSARRQAGQNLWLRGHPGGAPRHGVERGQRENGSSSLRGEFEMFKLPNKMPWRPWAPLPLRLVIGYGFIAHGWAKFSRGPAEFAKVLEQIGAPLPEATAWASTVIEILGGVAILAGAFVAIVSVPLIVMMLVAMFTVHLRYGFSAINTIGLAADGPPFSPPPSTFTLLLIPAPPPTILPA